MGWTRTLLATEFVFASDMMESGAEWPDTTKLDDRRGFQALRNVKRKLVPVRVRACPRWSFD